MPFVPIAASRELLEVSRPTPDEVFLYHLDTVGLIHAYGVLTFSDGEDRQAFVEALDDLEERSAEKWRELLEYGRWIVLDDVSPDVLPLVEITTVKQLRAWAQWVRLVRVQPPERISGLTFPSDKLSFRPFRREVEDGFAALLEVAKYGLRHTRTIEQASQAASKLVPVGVEREVVRAIFLDPLFAYSRPRRILIHDRYFGDGLGRIDGDRKGIQWVFEVINESVPLRSFPDGRRSGAELVVLTTADDGVGPRDAIRKEFTTLMNEVWSNGSHGIERAKVLVRSRYDRDEVIPEIPSNSAHERCFQLTHSYFGEEPGINADASPATTSFFEITAGVARLGAPMVLRGFEYAVRLIGSQFGDPDDHAARMNLVSNDYNVSRGVVDLRFPATG